MADAPQHICILGGGFGGLYTALRLSQLPWSQHTPPVITLVDHPRFAFSLLPYCNELVTEELQTWEIAPPFEELLAGTSIQFRQAEVTGIDSGPAPGQPGPGRPPPLRSPGAGPGRGHTDGYGPRRS